jgi:hypothetical protein
VNTPSDIKTSPRTEDWIHLCLGIPLFAIIAAILPLLALVAFYTTSPRGRPPVFGVVIVLIFGVFVGTWFMLRLLDRLYWCLTESELIGGMRGNTRISLSSLEKVVVGLPNKFAVPGLEKFAPPQIRANSMLLCFSDGSLLPMHLHGIPNGTRLMNELVSRFPRQVDLHYAYSKEEIKILRKADVNVLIRRGRRPNRAGAAGS